MASSSADAEEYNKSNTLSGSEERPVTIPIIGQLSKDDFGASKFAGKRLLTKTTPRAGQLTPRMVPPIAISPHCNITDSSFPDSASMLDSPTPRDSVSTRSRISFVALLVIVTCINSTFSLMAPIFPTEAERRGLTPVLTGFVFSIYSFTNFFVSPLHGRMMQRRYISRKSMLVLGLAMSTAASAGLGVSVKIPLGNKVAFATCCLLLRMINGIGAAAVDTSSMAMVAQLFRHSRYFGTALGALESCLAVGWMLGPVVGGYLVAFGGFSIPFYGAALLGLAMIPIPFFMPTGAKVIHPVLHSTRDVTPWQLLGQAEIALLTMVTVVSAAAVTFLDATLAPFLQDTRGFSAAAIGLCFAVTAASYAVATILAGWMSDRLGPMKVIFTGLCLSVVPFALLGPSPPLKPLLLTAGLLGGYLTWLSLILLGSGCAFSLMPVLPAILAAADQADLNHYGLEDLVSGVVGSAYYLGAGAGPVVGGAATALLGFAWASTAYGIGLLLVSVLLMVTLIATRRRESCQLGLEEVLLAN